MNEKDTLSRLARMFARVERTVPTFIDVHDWKGLIRDVSKLDGLFDLLWLLDRVDLHSRHHRSRVHRQVRGGAAQGVDVH